MKLYQISYDTGGGATCCAWCGTQAEARAREKELEREHGRWRVDSPIAVEVPTDKPGLLAWLNANAA
jgi:hypothetical protein